MGVGCLPFPSPENLPDPGTEPGSSALQADSLLSEHELKELRIEILLINVLF